MFLKKSLFVLVASLLLVAACGEDAPTVTPTDAGAADASDASTRSGVDGTRLVTSLSATELHALCLYIADVAGGPEVDCDGGLTIGGPTVAECEADLGALPAGCSSTVAVVEYCYQGFAADHCGFIYTPNPVCTCS